MPEHTWLANVRGAALGVAVGALVVGCSTSHKPEADPARLVPIMKAIDKNTPAPGGAPVCKPEQMIGGATLTQVAMPAAVIVDCDGLTTDGRAAPHA